MGVGLGQEKRLPALGKVTIVRDDADPSTHRRRNVLAWIRVWWSRVCFPGRADDAVAGSRLHLLVLVILPGLLLYPCLSFHLFEPDEGRYAQIPREMLTTGEWIVPTLQGEPYLDKPPLFYWCVMLSFALFGFHDWAARLVPALATHGTILIAYAFACRLLGRRPAFWGSLVLAFAPGFLGISRLLLLDGLLTFLVSLSLFAAYLAQAGPNLWRGWWYTAALACGLATLTKGPVALILLVPPLCLTRRLEVERARITWHDVVGFAVVVLAVNLPWYLAIMARQPDFAAHFFWEHNLQRFSDPFDHQRPLWFFVPLLWLGLLPASVLLWGFVRFLVSSGRHASPYRPPALGFFLLAGLWCFVFFSLSGCKLPTYILPAFPPLALALGCYLERYVAQAPRRRRWLIMGGLWWVLLCVAHWIVLPRVAQTRSPMGLPEQVQEWCGDPAIAVYCFPRPVDSVAFYLGRCDLASHRSKDLDMLIAKLEQQPQAVVLFSHRHSLDLLRLHLPARLRITEEAPLGLCKMAKIARTESPMR